MAVVFEGDNEAGQDGPQSLAAYPIGGDSSGAVAAEQPDGVLAVASSHGDELVQDLGLLRLGRLLIALTQRFKKFP